VKNKIPETLKNINVVKYNTKENDNHGDIPTNIENNCNDIIITIELENKWIGYQSNDNIIKYRQ